MQFQGNLGILVFGRKILKKNPRSFLRFVITDDQQPPAEGSFKAKNLWEDGMAQILSDITRFGRVGIFFDRKNFGMRAFFQNIDTTRFGFQSTDRRAEKVPQITSYPTQIISQMAMEGLADSVEFRRLSRKFIRRAKNANGDTLFFPEAIFGEEKTQKILQQIAGTQIKVVTLVDFFEPKIEEEKQKIEIFYKNEDPVFLKKRAEIILKTKLEDDCLKELKKGEIIK